MMILIGEHGRPFLLMVITQMTVVIQADEQIDVSRKVQTGQTNTCLYYAVLL